MTRGNLFIFGMGYSASVLAQWLRDDGWQVTGTRREAYGKTIAFDDRKAVETAISGATHILSSVPPSREDSDPVLAHFTDALRAAPARWIGYLSSTGVYGDTGGAWVDESAAVNGRRTGRNAADLAWQALDDRVRVFRLPGIYGPGCSVLERLAEGRAHRIDLPQQIFSRIHVDDIASAIIASFDGPAGVYNISDDLPAPQNELVEFAAQMTGIALPPLQTIEDAKLSAMARAFYAENRRVANGKAIRLLGWKPLYPTYREGLRACMATSSPARTNTAPQPANSDQR